MTLLLNKLKDGGKLERWNTALGGKIRYYQGRKNGFTKPLKTLVFQSNNR